MGRTDIRSCPRRAKAPACRGVRARYTVGLAPAGWMEPPPGAPERPTDPDEWKDPRIGARADMRGSASDALVRDAVRRTKAGDRGALEYLYVRYAGDVRRHVAGVIGDAHEAEDVTQNVFARLPDSIQRYEERSAKFSAWLLRVARNAAVDELRRRRPIPSSDLAASRPDAAEDAGPKAAAALNEALASLPEEQ